MATENVKYIMSLVDKFSPTLSKIDSKLLKTGDRMKKFGDRMGKIGNKMSLGVTLPIIAIGGAVVKFASDFEESESKFNTVFESIRNEANKTSANFKKNFGLSSREAMQLLGNTGDLLVGFGFTESAALKMSKQVNELAVDLASFTNAEGGAKATSDALTKSLLGERESLKTYGISINEAEVKARVLLNTKKGLKFASNKEARAYATLELATKQSGKAIGDFARTSGSFANQSRIAKARLEDLAVGFGKILLPAATKLLTMLGKLVEKFSGLSKTTKKVIIIIAGVTAIIGPLLMILPALISGIAALGGVIAFLTGPIGITILVVTALAVAFTMLWKKSEKFRNFFKVMYADWTGLFSAIGYLFNGFIKTVVTFGNRLSDYLGELFNFKKLITEGTGDLNKSLTSLKSSFFKIGEGVSDAYSKGFNSVMEKNEKLIGKKGFSMLLNKTDGDSSESNMFGVLKLSEAAERQRKLGLYLDEQLKNKKKEKTIDNGGSSFGNATSITSAAPKTFNIQIGKMIEDFTIETQYLKEGINRTKEMVLQALLQAINEAQLVAGI